MEMKDSHQEEFPADRPAQEEALQEEIDAVTLPRNSAPDESSDQEQPPTRPIVAGIGASAGGVDALQAFFEVLPEDLGVAFVVVIHLSPEHRSHLADILAARTSMPVEQVEGSVRLQGDHVYVIPPDRRLQITDKEVIAFPFKEPRGQRAPIDTLFRSLAEQHGDGFAVILSGGGSDGAVGVKAVKERGGLILVQDPAEAAYDSMPRAAIATGVADVVLPVRELAGCLADLTRTKRRLRQMPSSESPEAINGDDARTLAQILALLHARTGHDFTHYKQNTVLRRLGRRMQLQRKETLGDYLAFLRQNGEEVQALFDDLLISVTTFFRDPEAFEALQKRVIARLFEAKDVNDPIRVWAPGCATGEEAYSIAILLLEEAARRDIWPEVQIFASDLDEGALAAAREGRYPAAIEADVSPERLRRFFVKGDNDYRVVKEVRDCVLFATHNLLKDPPFSRLDLVSCRNLLIYLNRDLQKQVFSIFRYALRPGGYLFLGASETVEGSYFHTLDKRHHLFQARQETGEALPHLPHLLLSPPRLHRPAEHKRPWPAAGPGVHRKALEDLAPPSILVDERRHVVNLSETAGRYLLPPDGPLTHNLIELVRPELQVELQAALYRAFEKGEDSLTPFKPVRFNGAPRQVAMLVRPRPGEEDEERLALVVFVEGGEVTPVEAMPVEGEAATAAVRQLQEELRQTQERLRAAREEYEATNEELRAANEELQSINEEYRSAAEELETSKEELQSMNEELQTINSELKSKLEEVSRAHSDLENLMAATEIGTLFLNRDLRIHRFTPRLADLFNITSSDRGRPIGDFTHRLDYGRLEEDARQVLDRLTPIAHEVQSQDGRWFLVRLRPYRTVDNKIDGVVATFVNITEQKQAEVEIRAAREYAENIVETIHEPLVVLTPDLRVKSANPAFYEQFKAQPEQTEGRLLYELGNNQWDIPELRTLLENVLPENNLFEAFEVSHSFEDMGERTMLLTGRRLDHVQLILLAIKDITERKRAEALLRQLVSQEERHRVSQILHDDLQQLLYSIEMKMSFIRQDAETGRREQLLEHAEQISAQIDRAVATTRRLSVDLSPPVLQGEGFTAALRWLVTQMAELHNLQVQLQAEHAFLIDDENMRVLLFQMVRELLFNVVKHAETDRGTVTLREEAALLFIQVADEGRGFDPEAIEARRASRSGFGLFSMRERLGFFGGRIEIESRPGEGTRVTVYTPVELKKGQVSGK